MPSSSLSGKVAIVGVDESDRIGVVPDKSMLQLHAEGARNALRDAGLTLKDVDGLFTAEHPAHRGRRVPRDRAEGRGRHERRRLLVPDPRRARRRRHRRRALRGGADHPRRERPIAGRDAAARVERPDDARPVRGAVRAAPAGGLVRAGLHRATWPSTARPRSSLPRSPWRPASGPALNPKAMFRDPITVEDVLNSRMICWPFNLLDCCLVTDAGGAVVLTSAERARDLKSHPVLVLGIGEALDHNLISQMPDLTHGPARISGPPAFAMAGVTPRRHRRRPDLRLVHLHGPAEPGRPRLLQEGRGRRVRQRPADGARAASSR